MRPRLQKEFVKAIQQKNVVASEELFLSPAIFVGSDTEKMWKYAVKCAIGVKMIYSQCL